MTAAPSFVHPAPDPGPDVADRVLARVEATARRRRARRRAVVAAVPVVAVVALVAVAAVAGGRDGGEGVVTATEPESTTTTDPAAALSVDPNVAWTMPTLSADGRTLVVTVTQPCPGHLVHDAVETPTAVVVGVELVVDPPPGPGVGCAASLDLDRIEVPLREPLGDRPVYDGVSRPPRDDVLRQADLVGVTYVPDGFAGDPPSMTSADEPWQQTFRRPGADWYFAVVQVPTAIADRLYAGEVGTPTTVAGRPAELVTGPMGPTLETIRFELGGLTVSVWGEMQGPPTFTHHDELVRIAEGIRPPAG